MHPLARHLRRAFNQHPRRYAAGLAALLLGTGVTAFGIAPAEPNADSVVVRQLVESVPHTLAPASNALEAPVPFVLFRSDVTRRQDTVQSLLQRLGVSDAEAQQFLQRHPTAAELLAGPAGKLVMVETDDNQRLLRLSARWVPSDTAETFRRLVVERQPEGWTAELSHGEFTRSIRLSSGTIRSSLFAATDAAQIPDPIASQLADLFAAQIDFRRDLRTGDRFSVVYEALEADGEQLRYGRLLSAEFVNKGTSHQVLWFEQPGKKGAYYTFDGESTRRAFLASPLAFSRISSGYGMRFHPVHGVNRPHLGVDYAAPTGTPVRSVADGVVQFAGSQRGYGNVVFVRHAQDKVTVYAHLHRIDVRQGQRIGQGDLVGQVGCTGVCTGPHLHFEYRVKGVHRDPLVIAREGASGEPIAARYRPAFQEVAQAMRAQLASAATVVQASAY
jgi:murein DD-endopeptidase MepM/ murein hydrolase activator NlpD